MSTARREAILDQALELIIDNGLGELTMNKVAKRMAFSEPAMYRHFQNKQDLVISLINRLSSCFEKIFEKSNLSAPPEVFFPKYFQSILEYLQKIQGVTLLFLSESGYNRDQLVREELFKLFQNQTGRVAGYLEQAADRGQVRHGVEPRAASLVFMGTVQALTTQYLLNSRQAPSPETTQQALAIYLKGVVG